MSMSTMASSTTIIIEAINGNQNIPWSEIDKLSKSEFNQDYFNVCKVLLSRLHPTMFKDDSGINGQIALENLISKPRSEILIFIISCIGLEQDESFKRSKLLSLLKSFIYERDVLKNLFLEQCKMSEKELTSASETLLKTIPSIPTIVANVCQLKSPLEFDVEVYFKRLTSVIFNCLRNCRERLKNGQDTSFEFLSRLLGKIAVTGHSTMLWDNLIVKLVKQCEGEKASLYVWRRMSTRLLTKHSDSSLEPILKTIFCNCSNHIEIANLIGDGPKSDRFKFLLTTKFVVISSFTASKMVRNLVQYNHATDVKELFIPMVKTALNAWTSFKLMSHRSHDQNFYIYSLMMASCKFLTDLDTKTRLELKELVMKGIEDRISCPSQDIRDVGLFLGQTLLKAVFPNGPKMDFELDENGNLDIARLKKFLADELIEDDFSFTPSSSSPKKVSSKKLIEVLSSDDEDLVENIKEESSVMEPDEQDLPIIETKKPVYLNDCIEGLGDTDNVEWAQLCLQSLEQLIRQNRLAAKEIAVAVSGILIHMKNETDLEAFQGLKVGSLLAACLSNPVPVADYLTSSFYDKNNCMSHRLDILQILVMASQELSGSSLTRYLFGDFTAESRKAELKLTESSQDMLVPSQVAAVERSWQQVVDERIQKNTRIVSSKTVIKEGIENKFAKISGHFFYPLMDRFDGSDVIFHLSSFDSLIVARLIYSLSLILLSVAQSFESRRMARRLLQFVSEFTHHQESVVKKSIVFAVRTITMSTPPVYLIQELGNDLSMLRPLLMNLSESDPDDELRSSAIQSLHLLNGIIEEVG